MSRLFIRLLGLIFVIISLSMSVFSVHATGATTSGACAITPDKVDGQGLNVSGLGLNVSGLGFNVSGLGLNVSGLGFNVSGLGFNVSGLSLEQIVQDIWTNPVTPAWLTQLLPGVEGGTGYNTVPAAILIVDDFSTPTAHGYDVRKVFDDLVSAVNAVRDPDPIITLVNVDISGANYDSMLIASRIRNTVNSLLPNYQHFAVNMSFGLVPCEDPPGATITDSESGATFTLTRPFDFDTLQSTIASQPVVRNAAVKPVLECVVKHNNGKFTAYFGYQNDNTVNITIPIGDKNRFHPDPKGRGQPTVFMPGRQRFVFSVEFQGSNRVWTLKGPDNKTRTSTAGMSGNQRCTGTPTLRPLQIGMNGYGGMAQYTQQMMGMPANFVDDYLEYLNNKGATVDDPLNGLRPLLREYLNRSAQDAADNNPSTRFALIPVASSGNFRPILGSAPLPPSRFPEVIAVSATLGTFGNLWVMSHDGNVRAPGAGYVLARDAAGGVTRVGAGTSFAAPYVSMLSALWLTYPNACQFTGGRVPLNYDVLAPAAKSTNAIAAISGNSISPLACSKNTPPTLSLSAALTANEGQTVSLGSVSDADGDAVTVTSSLATSSIVNTSGTLTFTPTDGPLTAQSVTITATDARGAQTTATFMLTVNNVAPTAILSAMPLVITAGQTVTLSLGTPFDPGSVDTAAGFTYAFDCGTGAGIIVTGATNTLVCSYATAGGFTVRGMIRDKDGGIGESTLSVSVAPAPTPTACYAASVVSYTPGTRKDGSAISSGRTNPNNALNMPQNNDTENFVSLGFGNGSTTGVLVLDFYPNTIQNGAGLDVRVWETSFNDATKAWTLYPEAAHVFASQDQETWVLLGTTSDKDQAYDLASLSWARYIKLVDASDRTRFGGGDDSFDVDGVEGFTCLPYHHEEDENEEDEDDQGEDENEGENLRTQPEVPVIVDTDGDTVADSDDNCPTLATTDVTDSDDDGIGDACDETPLGELPPAPVEDVCALDAVDTDTDGVSDTCDTDDDGDGLLDSDEATLYLTNPLLADTDGDTISDGVEITNGTNPLEANAPSGS